MRDSARIDYILGVIRETWNMCPDLSIGDLMSRAAVFGSRGIHDDPFYVEDDALVEGLLELSGKDRGMKSDG
jgi:hypothetical protein